MNISNKTISIVFLDRDTIAPYAQLRRPIFEHTWKEYGATSKEMTIDRLQGCDIAIVNKVELRKEQLQYLPDLKMIAVAATGVNIIDLDYCEQHSITVSNIQNYATDSVPEHVFGLMLALRRNLFNYFNDIKKGQWQESGQFCFFNHSIENLAGTRLGIIGEGVLGKATAKLGSAMGMDVVIACKKGKAKPCDNTIAFEELISSSDVISLHCPLTAATENLIALKEFKQMKSSALLINTARGGIVNESDLVIALRQKMIAGAGFDVLTQEPPDNDHPLLSLTDLPNFILTPHIAWAGQQAMQTLCDQLVDNIESFVTRMSEKS